MEVSYPILLVSIKYVLTWILERRKRYSIYISYLIGVVSGHTSVGPGNLFTLANIAFGMHPVQVAYTSNFLVVFMTGYDMILVTIRGELVTFKVLQIGLLSLGFGFIGMIILRCFYRSNRMSYYIYVVIFIIGLTLVFMLFTELYKMLIYKLAIFNLGDPCH